MHEILQAIINFMTFGHIMNLIYVLNFIIALAIIFVEKKSPTATLAWVAILYILPVFGLFGYIVFSQHISRLKVDRMTDDEQMVRKRVADIQRKILNESSDLHQNKLLRRWLPMMKLNLDYNDALLTTNESVEIITDGRKKYEKLFRDIRAAKKSVHACYFVVKDDVVGRAFIELLTEKAREGLDVKLLMDALGSVQITKRDLKEFKEAGGQYEFYFKPRFRHMYFRINYRNHRKIVVIDESIAYIGGFNIAKEYAGLKKKFGYWRDTHLRIVGSAVNVLAVRFLLDWRFAHNPTELKNMEVDSEEILQD